MAASASTQQMMCSYPMEALIPILLSCLSAYFPAQTATAVDLDVYVEPLPLGRHSDLSSPSQISPASPTSSTASPSKGGRGNRRASREELELGAETDAGSPPPATGGTVDLMAGYGSDGYESAKDDVPITSADGSAVRTRTLRVKVGNAPLVVREKESLDSAQVGCVFPGQLVTVLREIVSTGKVRALIDIESISRVTEALTRRGEPTNRRGTNSGGGGSSSGSCSSNRVGVRGGERRVGFAEPDQEAPLATVEGTAHLPKLLGSIVASSTSMGEEKDGGDDKGG
jgi:hypothetical protein